MDLTDDAQPLSHLLDRRQLILIISALMSASFLTALNQAVVATAAPRVVADLGGFSLLSWVFTSYVLSSIVAIPIAGKLSDLFGRRIFLIGGIGLFIVASLLCGLAQSMPQLIGARVAQGLGGGTVVSCTFAAVSDLFDPATRAKYIGLFTGSFTLANVLGPAVGGLLTDSASWRWCFFMSVVVGLVSLGLIASNFPAKARSGSRPRIDVIGAVLLSLATTSLLLAIAWASERYGWGSPPTVGLFAASVTLFLLFAFQEVRHPEPIFPPEVYRNRTFLLANLTIALVAGATFGTLQYLPTFVQTALDGSATGSGIVTTPQAIGLLVTSIVGGQWIARRGTYRVITLTGVTLVLAAMVLLITLSTETPTWRIALFMAASGFGVGFTLPPLAVVIQATVVHRLVGVANSSRMYFNQLGTIIAAAIFGVILASSYATAFERELPEDVASRIPAATLDRFDDPTLSLNDTDYAEVRTTVLALEDGPRLLEAAEAAQRESVASAMHGIFIAAACMGAIALVLVALIRPQPLRGIAARPSAIASTSGRRATGTTPP